MSQRYNDNIKRPEPQDALQGISIIHLFCYFTYFYYSLLKCSRGPWVQEEALLALHLSVRIHPKSWFKEGSV